MFVGVLGEGKVVLWCVVCVDLEDFMMGFFGKV